MSGGSAQTRTETRSTRPWDELTPQVQGVAGLLNPLTANAGLNPTETIALAGMTANAQAGNPYASQVGNVTNQFLSGGTDRTGMVSTNLADYQTALKPYTTMSTNPYEDPNFQRIVGDTTQRTMDAVKSSYTGAGIPAASYGNFGETAGRGITNAIAPLAYQATNDLEARKRSALDSVYGAGNASAGLLSGLDQTKMGNMQAGVGLAPQALSANDWGNQQQLAIEAQRFGIPMSRASGLAGVVGPLASLGSDSTGTTTTPTAPTNWAQLATGAAIAGVGAFSGNPMMMANGASMGLGGLGGGTDPSFGSPGGPGLLWNSAPTGYYGSQQFGTNQQNPSTWIPAPYGRV